MFIKIGTEYYFYQNDNLGTPQKMTTISGAVVWSAKYGSFGMADIDHTSTVINNLRLPGQYYDGETGLHYNYNRYYSPDSGRYMTKDPLGVSASINLYFYSSNNPILFIDPLGLIFKNRDWVGNDTIHFLGGRGGTWLNNAGTFDPDLIPPIIDSANDCKCWVRPGTGIVNVYRGFFGIESEGAVGGGYYLATGVADFIDKHERLHIESSESIYNDYIKPMENIIKEYTGKENALETFGKCKETLEQMINWKANLDSFAKDEVRIEGQDGELDKYHGLYYKKGGAWVDDKYYPMYLFTP